MEMSTTRLSNNHEKMDSEEEDLLLDLQNDLADDRLGIFEEADPMELIMTPAAIQAIRIYEKTVEVVGFVGSLETKNDMFKFILSNQDGQNIQVIAWGAEATRARSCVLSDSIAHIDGAFAKPRHNLYSQGNTTFDLTISSNTTINILKKLNNVERQAPPPTKFKIIEDAINHSGEIEIEGFIRSSIRIVKLPNDVQIAQGCLTDLKHKLELRMCSATNINEFGVGDHVRVTGRIKNSHVPFLLIEKKENISSASSRKIGLGEILKGSKLPKRKSSAEELSNRKKSKS